MILKDKEKKRLKLHLKFDRALHAFLNSKSWMKWWEYCQNKRSINYYLISALIKFFEKYDKYKADQFDLYVIGHSHLDACWLWTKLSTIRRAIMTFQQNLEYFEKYPFYTFSQTSPQYYDWIRKLRPELFQKIKQFEREGRWEIIGGMWVEPDLNLPDGESLVRQRLYGQLFYLEHFDKIAKIESLEDSFGFNAQLPQILVKSGAETFWTTKLTWNDLTEFPFANFLWRGIDGSEIFTHMYKCNWSVFLFLSLYKRTGRKIKKSGLIFDASSERKLLENYFSEDWIKTCGIFFGLGDGGMGPLKEEIELLENLVRSRRLKFCTFKEYFDILKKECGNILPIWNDELYLEFHRGVYTSQANTKRLNRLCEVNLRNCEILCSFSHLLLKNYQYPFEEMEKLWKILLFNQFHDILPGSSIQDVYYEQEKELEHLIQKTNKLISLTLQLILNIYLKNQDINEKNELHNYAIIFNTLPWERDGFIKLNKDTEEFSKKVLKVNKISPMAFQIINLNQLNEIEEEILPKKEKELKLFNQKEKIIIENSRMTLTIDKLTGKIVSILFKELNRELIRKPDGIGIHIYKENKDNKLAWNIDRGYTLNKFSLGFAKAVQIIKDSDEIKTVRISFNHKKTIIHHFISLRQNSDLIEFRTNIDVQNKCLLFKVRFPFNLNSHYLTAEIPYGNLKRKIIAETDYEKGKWEFPAQKYIDISEPNVGVTMVNNSKYGFSSNKKGLYLTLLRTPLRPSTPFYSHLDLVPKKERVKYVDFGKNLTEYALWIHKGDFLRSLAWRKGYEYNFPLLYERFDNKLTNFSKIEEIEMNHSFTDIFKDKMSLVSISNPNIILQIIKFPEKLILAHEKISNYQEENQVILIIRLFETSGNSQEGVKIEFNDNFKISKIIETDLLERELHHNNSRIIDIQDQKIIILNFKKFEIKTLKLSILL